MAVDGNAAAVSTCEAVGATGRQRTTESRFSAQRLVNSFRSRIILLE